jgi:hypothetical protein
MDCVTTHACRKEADFCLRRPTPAGCDYSRAIRFRSDSPRKRVQVRMWHIRQSRQAILDEGHCLFSSAARNGSDFSRTTRRAKSRFNHEPARNLGILERRLRRRRSGRRNVLRAFYAGWRMGASRLLSPPPVAWCAAPSTSRCAEQAVPIEDVRVNDTLAQTFESLDIPNRVDGIEDRSVGFPESLGSLTN